jgi:hypothetical protein
MAGQPISANNLSFHPLHSIHPLCSALQQLTGGLRIILIHHVRDGVAKRANGVAKAREYRCLVLLRSTRRQVIVDVG